LEGLDNFYLEYSHDAGEHWMIVSEWIRNVGQFSKDWRCYQAEAVLESAPLGGFTDEVEFRFRSNVGATDNVYIMDIHVAGITFAQTGRSVIEEHDIVAVTPSSFPSMSKLDGRAESFSAPSFRESVGSTRHSDSNFSAEFGGGVEPSNLPSGVDSEMTAEPPTYSLSLVKVEGSTHLSSTPSSVHIKKNAEPSKYPSL
jgi:hypothetical protein